MSAASASASVQASRGAKALGDALGATLRVLKLCLAAGLALYFASGVCIVPDGHAALVLELGSAVRDEQGAVRVYEPGTYFTLPPPLGARVVIPMGEVKQVTAESFWYKEDAEDQLRALRRRTAEKPLVPGRDGYVVCGDGAILHLKVRVDWRVGDAARYYAAFGRGTAVDAAHEREFVAAMLDACVLRNALAVRMLSRDDATNGKAEYFSRVQSDLARRLQARGLALEQVLRLVGPQEPRQVEDAFTRARTAANAALAAVGEARTASAALKDDAEARANEALNRAQSEAKEIIERARRDATRAAELSDVLARDDTLRARLILDACARAFKGADIRPLAAPGAGRSFRYTLAAPAPAPAAGKGEEGKQ